MVKETDQIIGWQHLGILRDGGVSWTGFLKAWGVMQFGIPNARDLSSVFPEGEYSESLA